MRAVLILAILAALIPSAASASTPLTTAQPAAAAAWLKSQTRVAYGMSQCLMNCEAYFRRCQAAARTDAEHRNCRLRRATCEQGCDRFVR
jgi:hypothetical protein